MRTSPPAISVASHPRTVCVSVVFAVVVETRRSFRGDVISSSPGFPRAFVGYGPTCWLSRLLHGHHRALVGHLWPLVPRQVDVFLSAHLGLRVLVVFGAVPFGVQREDPAAVDAELFVRAPVGPVTIAGVEPW